MTVGALPGSGRLLHDGRLHDGRLHDGRRVSSTVVTGGLGRPAGPVAAHRGGLGPAAAFAHTFADSEEGDPRP